jgi:hypothetical protein
MWCFRHIAVVHPSDQLKLIKLAPANPFVFTPAMKAKFRFILETFQKFVYLYAQSSRGAGMNPLTHEKLKTGMRWRW